MTSLELAGIIFWYASVKSSISNSTKVHRDHRADTRLME